LAGVPGGRGRGASISLRSGRGSGRGAWSSENAGMSSERGVRILSAGCPRVPGEGSSAQGQSGAKARPKGVVDAQLVDIPVPPCPRPFRTESAKGLPPGEPTRFGEESDGGTQEGR